MRGLVIRRNEWEALGEFGPDDLGGGGSDAGW